MFCGFEINILLTFVFTHMHTHMLTYTHIFIFPMFENKNALMFNLDSIWDKKCSHIYDLSFYSWNRISNYSVTPWFNNKVTQLFLSVNYCYISISMHEGNYNKIIVHMFWRVALYATHIFLVHLSTVLENLFPKLPLHFHVSCSLLNWATSFFYIF